MSKLAIIDLDGVVSNNTERFNKAEEAKQQYLEEARNNPIIVEGFSRQKEATNVFWQTAFNPKLVVLDTVIEGVEEALNQLQFTHGYTIIFLTSRPESMRDATAEWLYYNNLNYYRKILKDERQLVMKPPSAQYIKTVTWKALTIQMLFHLFNASEILVVDDEVANLDEIGKWIASPQYLGFTNLTETIEALKGE